MSETRKTFAIAGLGLALLILALASVPRRSTPDEFQDRGESFFPGFTDPNLATTLEVVEFDESTAAAKPFKVTFKDGRWTIPSHHDYPADGKDRLARTAAGLIGLTKLDFRSANVADHETCGVIDPLDESAGSLKGRGKRVTIRDKNDQVLADLIFGKKLEDRPELRFVRIPDQKRVYVTKSDLDISTKFADWIEPDLLQVEQNDIRQVRILDYSINERLFTVDERDDVILTKDGDKWSANRMGSGQEVDSAKMSQFLRAIDEISLAGVRPKPEGLTADLKRGSIALTQENAVALQSRGYYFTRDGSLLSNEGELQVATNSGLRYILRFGEVLYGTGEAVSAGGETEADAKSGPGENRYLMVTAYFDPGSIREPQRPSNRNFEGKPDDQLTDEDRKNKDLQAAYDDWQKKRDQGKEKAVELNSRFAPWYYVISAASFDKVHLKRSDLVVKKKS